MLRSLTLVRLRDSPRYRDELAFSCFVDVTRDSGR